MKNYDFELKVKLDDALSSVETSVFKKFIQIANERLKSKFGISFSHTLILWELQKQINLQMKAISQKLAIPPTSLTKKINSLVKKELIIQTPDPIDKRVINVSLTDRGRILAIDAHNEIINYFCIIFSLSLSDEDQKALSKSISNINKIMKSINA